jgi:ABC-type glycerol-3-phosphate transport system permease component
MSTLAEQRAAALQTTARRARKPFPYGKWAAYLILGFGSVLLVAPFVWIIQAAFGETSKAFVIPPLWFPVNPSLNNFVSAFEQVPFHLFTWNTLKIATAVTVGQLITCSLAAYAFARLHFRGKNVLFFLLLSSLMIPSQVTLVPTFIIMRQLGLYNTHASLILPALISPFGVFLLRQYFLTIPSELEDAARVDGASVFTIYLRIILPLSGPVMTTLAILTFVAMWNNYIGPLIYINKIELQVITVGLTLMRGRFGEGALGPIASGIFMAVVPVLVVFLLLQRYIIKSIVTTGIKS